MVSKRTLINLAVFFLASFSLIIYGAVSLLGNPFNSGRTVSTVFEDASGLLPDFSASYNGVVVGQVTGVELVEEGVEVTVELDPGQTIPGDSEAYVVRASAVGEQRVDFRPTSGGDEDPVPDGGEVPAAESATPPQVSEVLDLGNQFLESIPADQLNTVIEEFATALEGNEENLAQMTRDVDVFAREFVEHEAQFRQLVSASPALLNSLVAVAPEFVSALENTADFTTTLADRRFDITSLTVNGARFADVANDLITGARPNLACLFSDLADLNEYAGSPAAVRDLSMTLDMNQAFFGPIDVLAVKGHARGFPQYGSSDRNDQTWLRIQLLFPPGEPPPNRYDPIRATPDVRPGGACFNAFGQGVGAVGAGNLAPAREESIQPTGGTATPLGGSPAGSAGGGSNQGTSGPVAESPVGDGFVPAPETDVLSEQEGDGGDDDGLPDQALPPTEQTGSEGDGTDWLWVLFVVALTGGAAWVTVLLSRRLAHEVSGDDT